MTETLFDELLACNLPIRIQPTGLSMHPFIRRGDYITITPLSFNNPDGAENIIAPGDCIIFREGTERWLIHRVIRMNHKNGTILTKGDALLQPDRPVTPEMIWGKVTKIHRVNSEKEYLLSRPVSRQICRLIALLSRGETIISSIFRLQRREVELSPGFEFITRIIKSPKWILTRLLFMN
ncbi:S24/S26 family peptidase [bacterium]|nr:S24/S26 family peptidase [bacterium]